MLNDFGTLTVRAVTGGAYPVKNALVRIIGAEEENLGVSYTLLTNIDGLTQTVSLPAPSAAYSQTSSAVESPYSIYNLEIDADGYYSKRIYGLMVFAGIDSLQQIDMIPISKNTSDGYPDGNINAVIPGNDLN